MTWNSSVRLGALLGACWLPAVAAAQDRRCDSEWPTAAHVVQIGDKDTPSSPMPTYDPQRPQAPYELLTDRYLYGMRGRVRRLVGRFETAEEAEAALRDLKLNRPDLLSSARPPFASSTGAYFVNETMTCKPSREQKAIEKASWVLEEDGVLIAGSASPCAGGRRTKTISIISCDSKRVLASDKVTADCEASPITTCINSVESGVFLFRHSSSREGGSDIHLRAYDSRKRRKVYSLDWSQEGGPDTELVGIEDVDGDTTPEITFKTAGTGARTKVLKWGKGKFTPVKAQ